MADGVDITTVILTVLIIVMAVVTWFEWRYLRKSMRIRRGRAAKETDELPDEAHNALVTTRAIVSTLAERSGIRNEEVDGIMREAKLAFDRKNYRVTIELTSQARQRLMALKAQQEAKGDLARIEGSPSAGAASEEPTTKELLQKEFPPNLLPSKFAISVAESAIEEGRARGRETARAETLLASARSKYEAEDYSGALSLARQAEKSARGESVEVVAIPPGSAAGPPTSSEPAAAPAAAVPMGSTCPACGTPIKQGDAFCRKCGTKVAQTACPSCGAELLADDQFCRKCGTRIPH